LELRERSERRLSWRWLRSWEREWEREWYAKTYDEW